MAAKEISETDEEIILAYKNGDQEAFKRLIARYAKPLYNFSLRLTDQKSAPDITQEIFIKMWKNMHRFDSEKASFKTWIFIIAKNTATDFLRKKRNILFSEMNTDESDEQNPFEENIQDESILPDKALEKLEENNALYRTLEKLSVSYREVLFLRYQEELTFDEIGKVLGKPLHTVKSLHRRAIIELRKMLG